ncbi:MAG: SDR family oxidoreductase [Caulobacterales bacterium]
MLAGKSVIVTGAGSGIGRATSKILAAAGAQVAVVDINSDTANAVAEDIRKAGHEAVAITTDVSDETQVRAMVDATMKAFGKLDGAFNNAGLEMNNKVVPDMSLEEWSRVINVNLTGVFLCMKHEMRAMKKFSAIVNTSSGDGLVGQPFAGEDVASKHGVVGLTRTASAEFRQTGVRVNAVCPGLILTPMIEDRLLGDPAFADQLAMIKERHSIDRFGRPEDIGNAVKWLLSDESSFVNGAAIAVDGGYTAR